MLSAKDIGLSLVVVGPEYKESAHCTVGAIIKDAVVPTWDWWSVGGATVKPDMESVQGEPTVFQWRTESPERPVGGTLSFKLDGDKLEVVSLPAGLDPKDPRAQMSSPVSRSGDELSWSFGPLNTKVRIMNADQLEGKSSFGGQEQVWTATRISGPAIK